MALLTLKLIQVLLSLTLIVGSLEAFVPSGSFTVSHRPSTDLKLFFGNNNSKQSVGKGNKKASVSKSTGNKDNEKKKPFIFLYGKPQYDWVNNRPMTREEMERAKPFDWSAAADRRSQK